MIIDTNKINKKKIIAGVILLIPLVALMVFMLYCIAMSIDLLLELIIALMPIILLVLLIVSTSFGIELLWEGLKGV